MLLYSQEPYHSPETCFFITTRATTSIYTLSLHDALPISFSALLSASPFMRASAYSPRANFRASSRNAFRFSGRSFNRSEEHTSELQSHSELVCRLLLEKKKPN